ncbi:MAG: AMP-binding protein [Gammaproteobacteria bacterium]|nr:AMP-binding protein [Gammaproteobacteria bacterium]
MQPIDLVYRAARLAPGAAAVCAPGVVLDYRELVARVDALAAALQALDPAPQSRVGVCAHNTLEHLLTLLAVMAADKIWVPLNPLDAVPVRQAKLAAARPSLVVGEQACLAGLDTGDAVVVLADEPADSAPDVAALMRARRGAAPRRHGLGPNHTQAIKFTGGSSGRAKGVLQPYRAWLAGAGNMLDAFAFAPGDRYLVAAPLTHGTSCYVTPMLAAGATLLLLEGKTTPAAIVDAFAARDVSATFVPPTLAYMILQALEAEPRRFPRLRLLIYGGAAMPPDRIRAAQSLLGPVVATNYGLTEAPQIITALTPNEMLDERNLASVGRAARNTRLGIMSAAGELLPAGEQGEIVVGGDLVMSGYLDLPEQTAETLVDGWLHTGDVGCVDERGYLYLKDRLKDVIISGGFNVYPSDVEAALAAHPAIHECVAFGLPDEKWGEAVQLAVELRPGASASESDVIARDIIAFARARLGPVQAPKRVHFLAELPRSAVGKVQRREVRELAARTRA